MSSEVVTPVTILATTHVFQGLPEPVLASMADKFKPHKYDLGQTVLQSHEPNPNLFVIERGTVIGLVQDTGFNINLPVVSFGPGDFFVSHAIFNGDPTEYSVVARAETIVHAIHVNDLRPFTQSHPELLRTLMQAFASRVSVISKRVGVRQIPLRAGHFDPELVQHIPKSVILRNQVIPIEANDFGLLIGMVDPANLVAMDEMRLHFPRQFIYPAAISQADFQAFVRDVLPKLFPETVAVQPAANQPAPDLSSINLLVQDLVKDIILDKPTIDANANTGVPELSQSAEAPPIIRLANNILALAIQKGASDIHLEPQEDGEHLRLRLDGQLVETQLLPRSIQAALTSRLKIVANLDIAEHRLPQDGRLSAKLDGRVIDFRVSSVPTKYGEKLVLRILDKARAVVSLGQVIGQPQVLTQVREMISQPYGIIFVTGPTGSGKTTTLYSALSELNKPDVNISTAEDPIEYELPRINQVQVNHDIGLDFARILRAFLRQDPDIILVGETRDLETAKTSIEASLTGHLVLTTLHTNSAAASFSRLTEMGIEPFLIANATIGIIAQRLVRRLCPDCREPYRPDPDMLTYLSWPGEAPANFFRAVGCDHCRDGYRGRAGIYEVLRLNDGLRKLVARGAEAAEIHHTAVNGGMLDLRAYALHLLQQGVTTIEDVLSAVVVHE